MKEIIIIVIILVIIVCIIYGISKYKQKETFGKIKDLKTKDFTDIYVNAEAYENKDGRMGLDICLEKCAGNCVEYGLTGKAWCFL